MDALGPEPFDPEQHAHWERAVTAIEAAGFATPGGPRGEPGQEWLSSLWDRVHALDAARPDAVREVLPLPELLQLAWSRDIDSPHGLDEGYEL